MLINGYDGAPFTQSYVIAAIDSDVRRVDFMWDHHGEKIDRWYQSLILPVSKERDFSFHRGDAFYFAKSGQCMLATIDR